MGFLDSSSSIVTAILTRKGRELLARNNGSFQITKYAYGDDEVNYQLYNTATDNDTDIRNLPVLEPSSNELTALRYRLVTAPKGTTNVAYLIANPINLTLQNSTVSNPTFSQVGTVVITTIAGFDSKFTAVSRSLDIASVEAGLIQSTRNLNNQSTALITIHAQSVDGTAMIDVIGQDTGAIISIPVVVTSSR